MKPPQTIAFLLLTAATVWWVVALSVRMRHAPIQACVQIADDGTTITYPPMRGYCVPEPRPKTREAGQ